MYRFEKINEIGRIELLDPESGLISCSYSNRFLGTCDFEARFIETTGRNLKLDQNSLSILNHHLKNGTEKALIREATLFVKGVASEFRTLKELHLKMQDGRTPAVGIGLLGSLRTFGERCWKRTQATSLISTLIR